MLKRILIVAVIAGLFAVSMAELSSATEPLPTGTRVEGECVWLYEFPDAGTAVCADADGTSCQVWLRHQTIAGPRDDCVV